MSLGLWNLRARPAALVAATSGWHTVARVIGETADGFRTASRRALGDWSGMAAFVFNAHYLMLLVALDDMQREAKGAGDVLDEAAASVNAAQNQLDASWRRVSVVRHHRGFDGVSFEPATPEEDRLVVRERAAAQEIRGALDAQLVGQANRLRGRMAVLAHGAGILHGLSAAEGLWLPGVPRRGGGVGVVMVDGMAVLSTGDGDDSIFVRIDPATGDQIVMVALAGSEQTSEYRIPADARLLIRGGGGKDTISLPFGTAVGFTVVGGRGSDRVRSGNGPDRIFGMAGDDELEAGRGADYVSGGSGHDYIDGGEGDDRLFGGAGRDTLYGLDGADKLSGGGGQDYLEGGSGNDVLDGGHGNDILSGGLGDDAMRGGAGDDVAYGGLGSDRTLGGSGADTSYDDAPAGGSSAEKTVLIEIPERLPFIRVEGTEDFIARVEADLDMLRSSPAGQALLESLREVNETTPAMMDSLTIREYPRPPVIDEFYNSGADSNWAGAHSVDYLPVIDNFVGAPPVAVLHHELAHVYDFAHGTIRWEWYEGDDPIDRAGAHGQPIGVWERQATGLPIDHDNDPATPEIIDPNHPFEATENRLRHEMGLPKREHYVER